MTRHSCNQRQIKTATEEQPWLAETTSVLKNKQTKKKKKKKTKKKKKKKKKKKNQTVASTTHV